MQSIDVILLAGRIRPSPLMEALDVPTLCLPIDRNGSLLHAWLQALSSLPRVRSVRAVVNTAIEAEAVQFTACGEARSSANRMGLHVVAEPAPWRGAAGIVRDVTAEDPRADLVLVCEANRLPPTCLDHLSHLMMKSQPAVAGVIGFCGEDQPAGLYMFTQQAIERIPTIGYHDLKEQFIPSLRRAGHRVLCCRTGDSVWRLNDLESYLACVRQRVAGGAARGVHISAHASVADSATFQGASIVESGAIIEDGAVIHDSVVLWGATIGARAVLSRSVIGSLARVSADERLTRAVLSPHGRTNGLTGEAAGRLGMMWPMAEQDSWLRGG